MFLPAQDDNEALEKAFTRSIHSVSPALKSIKQTGKTEKSDCYSINKI